MCVAPLHAWRRARGGPASAWDVPRRHSLARLRDLAERDCAVRAWLQFGRAPVLGEREIYDLRFDNGARSNFTTLRLREDAQAAPLSAAPDAMGDATGRPAAAGPCFPLRDDLD